MEIMLKNKDAININKFFPQAEKEMLEKDHEWLQEPYLDRISITFDRDGTVKWYYYHWTDDAVVTHTGYSADIVEYFLREQDDGNS